MAKDLQSTGAAPPAVPPNPGCRKGRRAEGSARKHFLSVPEGSNCVFLLPKPEWLPGRCLPRKGWSPMPRWLDFRMERVLKDLCQGRAPVQRARLAGHSQEGAVNSGVVKGSTSNTARKRAFHPTPGRQYHRMARGAASKRCSHGRGVKRQVCRTEHDGPYF